MIYKGMNPEERQMMQAMVERGYDLFTRRCAEGRNVSQDYIKSIGEGRVWLGIDALDNKLVDEMGNIHDAVSKAVELAGLESYKVSFYPEKKDPLEELLAALDDTTEEEKLILKMRALFSQPRIMARMDDVIIK